ncbi:MULTISPECIES: hypothetical protein [Thermocrispum]|jgi:hypothetical protein|uniref:Uncharacterized protein n=1 Tax=Thermocrispum agreste TaxID=37925 RepID=A0ABD6FDU0_9PSEU|nr:MULTISPECIES: hypothetical protein [Thermocrispum]
MTTTQQPQRARRPTLFRPALKIKDPANVEWQVEYRIAPWRRLIQPIAIVWWAPRRYSEVTPKRPAPPPPDKGDTPASRKDDEATKEPKEESSDDLKSILVAITVAALVAVLACVYAAFLIVLTVVEGTIRFSLALVVSIFAAVEIVIQWVVGAIRMLTPHRPGRVDVLRTVPENECIATLWVVTTQSKPEARNLTQALAAYLIHHAPVDLVDDPGARSLIAHHHGWITDRKTVHLGGGKGYVTLAGKLDRDGTRAWFLRSRSI